MIMVLSPRIAIHEDIEEYYYYCCYIWVTRVAVSVISRRTCHFLSSTMYSGVMLDRISGRYENSECKQAQ